MMRPARPHFPLTCLAPVLVALLAPALPAQAPAGADAALPAKPGLYRERYAQKVGAVSISRPYLLYLPPAYSAAPDHKQPLLIFLHGAGERGDSFFKLDANGPLRHLQDDSRFAAVFSLMAIYPQCPADSDWTDPAMTDLVGELIQMAVAKLNADPDRVYLTGLSMGGTGTWHVAAFHADKFAAIMPICARAPEPQHLAAALRKVPAWIIVGEYDGDFTRDSRTMFELLKAANPATQMTVFPNEGHGVWRMVYPTFSPYYTWLLRQKRSSGGGEVAAATQPAGGGVAAIAAPGAGTAGTAANSTTTQPAGTDEPPATPSAQRASARELAQLIRDHATGEMPSWGYPLLARFPEDVLDVLTPCLAAPDQLTRERATVALGNMGKAAAPAQAQVAAALKKAPAEREQRLLRWCLRQLGGSVPEAAAR